MEYDKTTTSSGPIPACDTHTTAPLSSGRGHVRVKCDAIDTAALAAPLTFPFSGRTAKNRFLKAPMTERLCRWNADGEDVVRLHREVHPRE